MGNTVSTNDDGTRVITLHGTIADAEVAQLQTRLVDAIWRDRASYVVVELGHGVTMDSTVFGVLLAADAVASDRNAVIEFRCQDRAIRDELVDIGLRAA